VSMRHLEAFRGDIGRSMNVRSPVSLPGQTAGSSESNGDGDPRTGPHGRAIDDMVAPSCDAEEEPSSEIDAPVRVVVANSSGLLADAIDALLNTAPDLEPVGTISLEGFPRGIDLTVEPDVVLVECLFTAEPCLVLLQRVRDRFPTARALVVCQELDDDSLAELVAAGALGCLTPNCRRDELLSAIRRVSEGEILFPAALLMRLLTRQQDPHKEPADAVPDPAGCQDSMTQPGAERTSPADLTAPLAPRERQVLEILAKGRSTEEVADALGITIHTVRTHLKNAMAKLNAHSKLEAVVVALRKGLIELHE